MNFQMHAGFKNSRGTRVFKLPTSIDQRESKKFSENIYFGFTDYTLKPCVTHNKLENSPERDAGIPAS